MQLCVIEYQCHIGPFRAPPYSPPNGPQYVRGYFVTSESLISVDPLAADSSTHLIVLSHGQWGKTAHMNAIVA